MSHPDWCDLAACTVDLPGTLTAGAHRGHVHRAEIDGGRVVAAWIETRSGVGPYVATPPLFSTTRWSAEAARRVGEMFCAVAADLQRLQGLL